MYKLKLVNNKISAIFQVSHCIRKVCKHNTAIAQKLAKNVINKGEEFIVSGTKAELISFQNSFSQRGLIAIIECHITV